MEEKEVIEEQNTMQSLKELVETELKDILNIGIQEDNIDNLGKLIDIHKDIENEEYWKEKKEVYKMRYYDENRYGDGRYEDNRYGNEEYGAEHSYGRRGRPMNAARDSRGRYRGPEEKMHEMMEHYGNYSAASDAASRGNYGAEEDSMKSLDYMLKCVCMFMDMLEEEAGSPEETQMIKKYRKKMSE